MRPVSFQVGFIEPPDGSCLAVSGKTKVLCTATISQSVPPFIEGSGKGWLTAEYAMLPGSTSGGRKRREISKRDGRSVEIQRLIGRSLRAALDMASLGETLVTIDCDVLQADGGTRTAAISGGWVALYAALEILAKERGDSGPESYLAAQIAAVSVGIVGGKIVCDLDYAHDSRAEVDMNVVMAGKRFVEIQGTGERGTFDRSQLDALLDSAAEGIETIFSAQDSALHR
jgi:ribonuclease PH